MTEGKDYFLVDAPRPGQAETLRRSGNVREIDARTFLSWSSGTNARDILSPEFEIMRLSVDAGRPLFPQHRTSEPPASSRLERRRILTPDAAILQMTARVSLANLASNISSLESFRTRYASTPNCEAAGTFLRDYFSSLGLETELDAFTLPGIQPPGISLRLSPEKHLRSEKSSFTPITILTATNPGPGSKHRR